MSVAFFLGAVVFGFIGVYLSKSLNFKAALPSTKSITVDNIHEASSHSPLSTSASNDDLRLWSEDAALRSFQLHKKIEDYIATHQNHLASLLSYSLQVLDSALRLYGPEGIYLAFNGGKDATIVAELYCATLAKHYQHRVKVIGTRPRAVFFQGSSQDELFKEQIAFLQERVQTMDLASQ